MSSAKEQITKAIPNGIYSYIHRPILTYLCSLSLLPFWTRQNNGRKANVHSAYSLQVYRVRKKIQANFQVLSLATIHSSGLGREYAPHGNSENKCLTSEILSDLYRKPQEQKAYRIENTSLPTVLKTGN